MFLIKLKATTCVMCQCSSGFVIVFRECSCSFAYFLRLTQ